MFRRIMVPLDLAHVARLEKALAVATDLARQQRAELVLVGVTGTQPGTVARTPKAFAEKLDAYAGEVAARCGLPVRATSLVLHDVTADLDRALIAHARDLDADLIVMASHVPGAIEHVIASNAGYVASHAPVSVFVVRG